MKICIILLEIFGLTVALRCPEKCVTVGEKCFYPLLDVSGNPLLANFSNALNFCEDLRGTLAAPKNLHELEGVNTASKNSDFWISAFSPNDDEDFFWIEDGTQIELKRIVKIESGHRNRLVCVASVKETVKTTIRTILCDEQKPVVCEVPKIESCLSGWKYFEELDQCYKAIEYESDQASGELACQFELSELASIHNKEENEFIGKNLLNPNDQAWIGYEVLQIDNSTLKRWTDDSVVNYTDPIINYAVSKIEDTISCPKIPCPACLNSETTTSSTPNRGIVTPKPTMGASPNRGIVTLECPYNFNISAKELKCYKKIDPSTFNEAKKSCESLGSTLAIITEKGQEEAIRNLLLEKFSYDTSTWLGIIRDDPPVKWKWIDGTPPAYENWKKIETEDKEKCARMVVGKEKIEWQEMNCEKKILGVCQKDATVKQPLVQNYLSNK